MSKQRRREETEQAILDALRDLIVSQGFRGVGMNAVARRAGVSKELIYRYFGGLDELILAMMRQKDYWSMGYHKPVDADGHRTEMMPDAEVPWIAEVLWMLMDQLQQIRTQPDLQEIRRWELIDASEITLELAQMRENASLQFLSQLEISREHEKRDNAAIIAILLAGILYLVLRSKTAPRFFGLDLDSEDGWRRLEGALQSIVPKVLAADDGDPATSDDERAGIPEAVKQGAKARTEEP